SDARERRRGDRGGPLAALGSRAAPPRHARRVRPARDRSPLREADPRGRLTVRIDRGSRLPERTSALPIERPSAGASVVARREGQLRSGNSWVRMATAAQAAGQGTGHGGWTEERKFNAGKTMARGRHMPAGDGGHDRKRERGPKRLSGGPGRDLAPQR